MARTFSLELSTPGSRADAQARLRGVITERLRRSAAMQVAKHDPHSLSFRLRVRFPPVPWLYRPARRARGWT